MCLHCPDCNADAQHDRYTCGCSDYLGNNHKSLGGYAGLATALAFATEFQGDGTPHGHGFVCLANMYQHSTLEQIADMLEHNIHKCSTDEMVQRITDFMEHLHREDHFNDEQHQASLESLEKDFHNNNAGPTKNVHLSVRPSSLFEVQPKSYLWSSHSVQEAGKKDASHFTHLYEEDVQFIFSRVQHHWHKLDEKGNRQPMQYCRLKGRRGKNCCKAGFPKKVIRDAKNKLVLGKYRVRIVCKGVAAELDLKTSVRRNMWVQCLVVEDARGSVARLRCWPISSGPTQTCSAPTVCL